MPTSRRARRRLTIKDVARIAQVSPTTVSNVLNGRTYAMAAETLQRVQEAIRALNYRPSSAARGMVTDRSATIGLILTEIETPLFLQALSCIEPIARSAGYNILLSIARNLSDEQHALNLLLEKQVDGILFLTTSEYTNDDHLDELLRVELPVVLVNRATTHAGFDQVHWDNVGGVVAAAEHLIRQGHTRIAHLVGPLKRRSTAERLQGYRLALERHGLEYCEDYVRPADYTASPDTWRQSALELLDLTPRPTAIIASDDIVAATVMQTVHSTRLRVPEDVAIVGFDDQPFCVYLNPQLTTVRLPIMEAGKWAVEALLQRIGMHREMVEHITLPCSLIVRDSCGAKR